MSAAGAKGVSGAGSRPRRSVLFVPGSNERALEKACGLPADCLIFDLEDAVAPEGKDAARAAVLARLAAGGCGKRERIVRINDPSGADGRADLAALAAMGGEAAPDAVLLPKTNTPEDLNGLPAGLTLWVMIETPRGVLNCAAIADRRNVACLVAGTNDLAKEMRLRGQAGRPGREGLAHALSGIALAARASRIAALDGVFNDVADAAALRRECRQGAAFGFDGKTLIHPGQIETANEVFAPAADELAEAEAVIAAFEMPENAGKGVIKVNGKMTERLHLEQARHVAALDRAIRELEAGS